MSSGAYLPRLALLAALASACGPPTETATPPPSLLTGTGPFVVSNAVVNGATGAAPAEPVDHDPLTYISLPPGSLPNASAVSIRVERTGAVVSAALLDGGLDPVAVPAAAGDTVSLTVEQAGGVASVFRFTVSIRKPPVIVRTRPPKNKRDVALNIRLQVIFSEPISFTSLTPLNFELRASSGTVPGQLGFANGDHTAIEFIPASDLASDTDYELVLRSGIRDNDGTPLEAVASIPFSTISGSPTPVGFGSITGTIRGISVNGQGGNTYPVFIVARGPGQSPRYSAATSSSFTFQGLPAGEWTLAFSSSYEGGYPNIRVYADTTLSVSVFPNQTVTVPEMVLRPVASSMLAILVERCPWGFTQTPTQQDWGDCDGGYWGGVDVAVEVQGVSGTATAGVHYSFSIAKEDWKFELYGVPTGEYDVSVTPLEGRWLLLPWQLPSRRILVLGLTTTEFDYWYLR